MSGDAAAFARDDAVWAGERLGYRVGGRIRLIVNDREGVYTVKGVLGGVSVRPW